MSLWVDLEDEDDDDLYSVGMDGPVARECNTCGEVFWSEDGEERCDGCRGDDD